MSIKPKWDTHMHTLYSDGHADTMCMCRYAADMGLRSITITDHTEIPDYWEKAYDIRIRRSYAASREAAKKMEGRLEVYAGMEIGRPLDNLEASTDACQSCDFDVILASVHGLAGWDSFNDMDRYDSSYVTALFHAYLEYLLRMTTEWGDFDVLAHLTYPLEYLSPDKMASFDFAPFDGQLDNLFQELIRQGKALELNAGGLRYPARTLTPDRQILERYARSGGRLLTVGADAHTPGNIGKGLETALKEAKMAGFREQCMFVSRRPVLSSL